MQLVRVQNLLQAIFNVCCLSGTSEFLDVCLWARKFARLGKQTCQTASTCSGDGNREVEDCNCDMESRSNRGLFWADLAEMFGNVGNYCLKNSWETMGKTWTFGGNFGSSNKLVVKNSVGFRSWLGEKLGQMLAGLTLDLELSSGTLLVVECWAQVRFLGKIGGIWSIQGESGTFCQLEEILGRVFG